MRSDASRRGRQHLVFKGGFSALRLFISVVRQEDQRQYSEVQAL